MLGNCAWFSPKGFVEQGSFACVSKSLRRQTKMVRANLRGTAGIPVKNVLKHFHLERGNLGNLMTSTAKKEGEDVAKKQSVRDGESEPIVAFNKPPLPPVLGPLIALSLLEMGSGREGRDE